MKFKVTLFLSALALVTLALGLVPAQATPIFTSACVQVSVDTASPSASPSAAGLFADLQPAPTPIQQATATDCASFCARAHCTEGNVCGPCANGGCGCHPSSGGA
jgi:hypothetical protein